MFNIKQTLYKMIVERIANEINRLHYEEAKHLVFNENLLTDDIAERLNNYLSNSSICKNCVGENTDTKFIILNYNHRYIYIHIHYDMTPADEIMVSVMSFDNFDQADEQLEHIEAGSLVYNYDDYE